MTLLAITLLLGLAVLASAFPRPIGYGPVIFRDEFGGQGWDGSINYGNMDMGHMGRHQNSLYNGGSFALDRSFGNINGRGASVGNGADIYDSFGGQGWDGPRNYGNMDMGYMGRHQNSLYNGGSFALDRSFGNINGRGASVGNRADIYDSSGGQGWDGSRNYGNMDMGYMGRHQNSLYNGDSFALDRSFGNIKGRGASVGNGADNYDSSGAVGNDQRGRISGNIFRNFGRDGIELGGDLTFE